MTPEEAYTRCEAITREQAKNFAFGIRLLPPPKRAAMSAVYAYARRVDDISDGDAPAPAKLSALAAVRADTDTLRRGSSRPDDAVLVALADAGTRYPIPWDAFDDLVTGCEADARGESYTTIDELVQYCRYVAGSIGRLSLAVFGTDEWPRAVALADDLGVALQLTNILRDIREDREMGRVYLPADDVERFGCASDVTGPRAAVAELVAFEANRACEWFDGGLQLLPLLDRRSRACVGAMAGIYRRVLGRIEAHPDAVLDGRMSLPTWEKLWVAAQSLAGSGARPRETEAAAR
jgi:phytoene synthase